MKKRVADIIKDILVKNNIKDCFTLTGGGAMHLNDAFGNADDLKCTYFLHEQGAAIAAEAYARVNGQLPVVCVTTGPGGTNALTGVLCAWLDNIPMLVISGQVKTSAMIESTGLKLRQFGEQEYNIVDSVKEMTKFAVTIKEVDKVKYYLQKAIYLANSGRRGPCWLDIPLDIQGVQADEEDMKEFIPNEPVREFDKDKVLQLLQAAKRPVILAGSAIRTSDSYEGFLAMCQRVPFPVIAAKSVADIMTEHEEQYFGNFGINGGRAGNFIVQNADCILALGCRLSFGQIGFNYKTFSPDSKKIVVDVDENELKKETIHVDCPVHADLKDFLNWMNSQDIIADMDPLWIKYCGELRDRFPIYQKKFQNREKVNAYYFAKTLQQYMTDNAICVLGNSCSSVSIKQCGIEKRNQRMWGNINCGTMGYDIPAAIGAAIASGEQVICCAGDGSFQMNIQELQTIVNYELPIKLFVFNNGGYRSIILSQSKNFNRLSGCTEESGLKLPQLKKIAEAYNIPYYLCDTNQGLQDTLGNVFEKKGYAICEIVEDIEHEIEPKLSNKVLENGQIVSPSISDLYPFLDPETYHKYATFFTYLESSNE